MLDYETVLKELDQYSKDIAKFVRNLKNFKFEKHDNHRYSACNDMMLMIQLFNEYLLRLHTEATECRRRKKTTPTFEKLYCRALEYRDTVENNRTMYSLMFG